jgi:hypothetical protein
MSRRLTLPGLAAAALLVGAGCYQDDTTTSFTPDRRPLAKVLLTDAPFPYDSVASVNIHVVRIDANEDPDTTGGGEWVRIAEPRKSFNLLELQQGTTAFVGEGELPAGQYRAIRMTIDTSLSSIVWSDGAKAPVNWQNFSGSNEMPLYALVESPVDVPTEGAEIVIDFDVGRSFLYAFYGTREFIFTSQLRAINSAATGAIAGTVTTPSIEGEQPVRSASVYVEFGGPCACDPPNSRPVVATGRTDAAGYYKVAFVRAGTYMVRIEPPYPFLETVVTSNVQVTAGATTTLPVSLPEAGSGGAYIRISGPSSVGVGGTVTLIAAVGDAQGNPVPDPVLTWTSAAPIATVTGTSDTGYVTGQQPGGTWITASSPDAPSASHWINVVGSTAPVATVTVVPGSAQLTVGQDSVLFYAELRDAEGIRVDRPVSWFGTDNSVFLIQLTAGQWASILPRGAGTALLRATSEGKSGEATITVR